MLIALVSGILVKGKAQIPIPDPTELSVLIEMLASITEATAISKETVNTSRDMYEIWKDNREELKKVTDFVKTARQISGTSKKVAEVFAQYGASGIAVDDVALLEDIEPEVLQEFERQGAKILDGFIEDLEELAKLAGKESAATMNEFERLERMDVILSRVHHRERMLIRLNSMLRRYVKMKREGEVMNRLADGKF